MSAYRPGVAAVDAALMLEQTPPAVWEALRGQRLFITGGTGFIGCWLLEALLWGHEQLDLGLQLSVLSRRPEAFRAKAPHLANHPAVTLLAGDCADLSQVHGQYDIVLHAATDVVSPAADPLAVYHDIVNGTAQTLRLAERCGASRYLLTSSGAVYGAQPPGLTHVDEHYAGAPDPALPNSAYGQGKRVAEWLLACQRQRQPQLQTRIARCFAFVGPYMALDAQFAIGNFIRDARNGDPIRIGGDGTPYRSYLYAADLAVWLLTVLVQGDHQPYNIGSDQQLSIAELAHQVNATLGGRATVEIARAPSGAPASYYVPAVQRARALGLRPYTSLGDAITRTAGWTAPSTGVS
ncbi:NAD-dependent epimerase/dehydratase family protein [Duganella lactea]|nr:NAD-dependent epimerase/dehydratase family protein [Duganella lactea]